jgi:beta-aspartyl-peptidase (threonine type)
MMKLVLAKWAADRVLEGNHPAKVAPDAIHYLHRRLHGHGGIILLDGKGRFGLAHNTPRMAWAVRTPQKQDRGIKIESIPALQPLP